MPHLPRSTRLLLAVALLAAVATGVPAESPRPAGAEPHAPPPAEADEARAPAAGEEAVPLPPGLGDGWYASIETSMGTIVARLLPAQAPQSVAWFAGLANGEIAWPDPLTGETRKEPYYDGLVVTRSVALSRFEAGDRTEIGQNAPRIFVPAEGAGPVNFSRPGRLGHVRSSLDRINAVRFFVTAGTLPFLNGLNPCFGEVVAGQGVVNRISEVRTRGRGTPLQPVTIRRIRVTKVGDPPPLPTPVPHEPKAKEYGPHPTATSPGP